MDVTSSSDSNSDMEEETSNSNSDMEANACNSKVDTTSSSGLVWKNLTYKVLARYRKKTKWKSLLKNVSGEVRPSEMVAIMGSGKTTLLNVLAARVPTGKLSGSILLNDTKRNPKNFKKDTGYVEQDDLLYPKLSVRETIDYAAQMGLPSNEYDQAAKKERVEKIIQLLRLHDYADRFVGYPSWGGISGEERRRTLIGVEMVADPKVLFLDEPTSKLDSNSAFSVCKAVRNFARSNGRCVLMTLHQPNNKILDLFDKIILLADGEMVFCGTKNEILDYFANFDYPCPQYTNLADHFLDLTTNDLYRMNTLVENYRLASQAIATVKGMKNEDSLSEESIIESMVSVENQSWHLSWPMEFSLLLKRAAISIKRDIFSIIVQFVACVFFGLLIGSVFINLGYSQSSIQNRVGLFTLLPISQTLNIVMPLIGAFAPQRKIMVRERMAGSYRVSSFFLAKLVSEIPPLFISTIIFNTIVYFLVHLQYDVSKYFLYMAANLFQVLAALGFGLAIGSGVEAVRRGHVIAAMIIMTLMLFGGGVLNNDDIPSVFIWIRYTSFIGYLTQAFSVNEFTGLQFSCLEEGAEAAVCFRTGEQALRRYGLDMFTIWECNLINLSLAIGFFYIAYIFLQQISKPRSVWI